MLLKKLTKVAFNVFSSSRCRPSLAAFSLCNDPPRSRQIPEAHLRADVSHITSGAAHHTLTAYPQALQALGVFKNLSSSNSSGGRGKYVHVRIDKEQARTVKTDTRAPTSDPSGPSASETPGEAAHAYYALAGMHAAIAAPFFIFPEEAALVMFQHAALPVDAMQVELLRMLGTGFVAASITAWTLKGGADRRVLHKPVYRRLNWGLITFSAAALTAQLLHIDQLEGAAAIGLATALGMTAAVPAYYYAMTSGHLLRLGPMLKGLVNDLSMVGRVTGGKSFAYAALTPAFYGAGLACMLTPEQSLVNVFLHARGPDVVMLWRVFGAAMLMIPTWTISLKEAADRRVLDRPPYISLNMGLVLTGLAIVAILSPWWTQYSGGPLMPLMLGTWAAAAAAGAWGELSPTDPPPSSPPG